MALRHRMVAFGCHVIVLALLTTAVHAEPDKQVIRRVVKREVTKIFACYELHGLPHAPRIVVEFTIGTKGRVTFVVASGGGDKPVQACIAGVFKRMRFPPPKDVIKVTYPIQICTAGQ